MKYIQTRNEKIFSSILLVISIFLGQFAFCQNQLILQNIADSSRLMLIPINEKIHLDLKTIKLDSISVRKMESMEWHTALKGRLNFELKQIKLDTGSLMKDIGLYTKLYGINNNEITVSILNEGAEIKPKMGRSFSIIQTYSDGVEMRTIKWDQISEIRYYTTATAVLEYTIGMIGFTTWIATLIIPPFVSINYESRGFNTKKYFSLVGGGFVTGAAFFAVSWQIGKGASFHINQQPNLKKLNKHEWKIVSQ